MQPHEPQGGRERDVWRRLATVTDPELDEPITAMGFVERLHISGRGEVEIDFRLPTYWCSPNFAYLMADGIRRAVLALGWVTRVTVRLQDHCFADRVNAGVNEAREFGAVFTEMADGTDLHALRAKFREKAFQRRQEALLLALRDQGLTAHEIATMTLADLDAVVLRSPEAQAQRPRYREIVTEEGLAMQPGDAAFCTWSGELLTPEGFADHLQALRSVRINMEFNGAICRGLQSARYKDHPVSADEPELIDFILGRVPPPARKVQTARH